MPAPSPHARRGVGGVLVDTGPLRRQPGFRRLWTGQLIASLGSQLTVVAVAYQTYRLTGSTAMVGLVSLSGLVLANSLQRLTDIPAGLDSALLEDRTPLVVKGVQITPSGSNRFKNTDNVVVYTEIYEPLLASANPPLVGMAYTILERESNKKLFFTDVQRADEFVQKGNPVIPIGLKVKVNDLKPGSYRLLMQAVDSAKNNAPSRIVDFDIGE